MNRYIDAGKLIAEIDRRIKETKSMKPSFDQFFAGQISALKGAIKIAESLQQKQPEVIDHICSRAGIPAPYMDGNQWCILKGDNIQVGVVGFGDTKEDALVDFIKNVPIQQERVADASKMEQPGVDLSEETITREFHTINDRCFNEGIEGWQKEKLIARHFYELGRNARKEE